MTTERRIWWFLVVIFVFALNAVFTDTGQSQTRDTYLPWEGGAAYYAKWRLGPPSSQDYCTRGVWLQSPWNAPLFEGVGVNQYVALDDGTVEYNSTDGPILPLLRDYKMPVFGDQATGLTGPNAANHLFDPIIDGWVQQDEPDNAQPLPNGSYGPCVPPSEIISLYKQFTTVDPNRPIFLGLGQGTGWNANSCYYGRGSVCCAAGRGFEDYPEYIEGADIVASDVYPENDGNPLWWISRTTDRLRYWSNYAKPVWQWIELVNFGGSSSVTLTPAEVEAEVWMSIIHGARGVGYFVHQFAPVFEEDSIFFPEHADVEAAVAKTNIQLAGLARPLNEPPVANGVTVTSANPNASINVLLKRYGGSTFVLAVNDGLPQNQTPQADPMEEMSLFCRGSISCTDAVAAAGGALSMSLAGGTTATFALGGFPRHATAIVLGENLKLSNLPVNCPAGGYYACDGNSSPDYFVPAGPNPITYTSGVAVGHDRTIPIINGVFRDSFDTSYAVHLYQILFDPNPGAPLVGDVNGDGKVDYKDVQIVKAALGTTAGMPGYDPRADVIRDGVVDDQDLQAVLEQLRRRRLPPFRRSSP
jgi:hypothetical protein